MMSLINMSFYGGVIILVVIGVRAFTVNRLPKKTFPALWGIALLRLLLPFSFPSPLSAYSMVSDHLPPEVGVIAALNAFPSMPGTAATDIITSAPQLTVSNPPPYVSVWAMGFLVCSLFFAISYIKCIREFREALPVVNEYVENWRASHRIARTVVIRQSDRISAPLTYGIFKPVILMPKDTDWKNLQQAEYILTHEFIHIRRFDAAVKLLLTVALCIHWFNPLVWVMYILANRDIELSCDEGVVRSFGEAARSAYARTLIGMEERKCRLTPLCNNFSKNAIEERITAIMKLKKTSLIAVLFAAALIVGTTVVFATSAIYYEPSGDKTFGDYERQRLDDFKFYGYENMSVSEYREKALTLLDTSDYGAVIDKIGQNNMLQKMRYNNNQYADFLFNVLLPLIAEDGQPQNFIGYAQAAPMDYLDERATLEYQLTATISDGSLLKVKDYYRARQGVEDGLQKFLQKKSREELVDETAMDVSILAEIAKLKAKWDMSGLTFNVTYRFQPMSNLRSPDFTYDNGESEGRGTPGTEADYQSLLTLKTPDYESRTVADFNMAVLEWGNAEGNFAASERIGSDLARNDIRVPLTEDELAFVISVQTYTGVENSRYVKSNYTGKPEEDPILGYYHLDRGDGDLWCSVNYELSYHIADKTKLTVGERDDRLTATVNQIKALWDSKTLDALVEMKPEKFRPKFEAIAAQNSNELLQIKVVGITAEATDERKYQDDPAPPADSTAKPDTVTIGDRVLYLINNEEELGLIGSANYPMSVNYMLNSDIVLSGQWRSIGDFDHPFTGIFSGNGYEIKNLTNTDPDTVFAGLFGYAKGAEIYNVILRNVDISDSGALHSGAVVAMAVDCKVYDNTIIN